MAFLIRNKAVIWASITQLLETANLIHQTMNLSNINYNSLLKQFINIVNYLVSILSSYCDREF